MTDQKPKNKPTAIAGLIILIIIAILLIAVSVNFLFTREKIDKKWFESEAADIIAQPSQTETVIMHSVCRVDSAKVVNGIVNSASGSGFCVFEPGLLVTAYHVVKEFNEYAAYFDKRR